MLKKFNSDFLKNIFKLEETLIKTVLISCSNKMLETEKGFQELTNQEKKCQKKRGNFTQDFYMSSERKSIYCFGSLFFFLLSISFVPVDEISVSGGRNIRFRLTKFSFPVYENVRVSLINRRTAVPIDGLVGIEVACDILNK